MILKSENPLRPGYMVWRGWFVFPFFGVIAEVGEPYESEGDLLVPVRYMNGEYGVVHVVTFFKHNGLDVFHWRELPVPGSEPNTRMRTSDSMPKVVLVTPKVYRFSVSEAGADLLIDVPRVRNMYSGR